MKKVSKVSSLKIQDKATSSPKSRGGIKVLEKSGVRCSVYTVHGVKCLFSIPGRLMEMPA